MRRSTSSPGGPFTRQTSTASALADATANRTPPPSAWAPSGKTGTVGEDRAVVAPPSRSKPPITPDLTDLVIRMDGVAVRRGPTTLLADVDWAVELDERWVVLGPNGAGKTTLLRLAA